MMGRVIVRNYRVDVFAAERLVGVGAAEQQLARTGFEEDPDVVLALLLRCQFVSISHFLLLNAGGWGGLFLGGFLTSLRPLSLHRPTLSNSANHSSFYGKINHK